MNTVMKRLTGSMLLIGAVLAMSQTAYAAVAGHVQFVYGNVQITSAAGQTHQAQKGDAVSEGDMLTSALGASAQIKMQDGGFVAVRSDTKMKFDQFVFAGKQDGSEKSFFSLFKGGFRAVTGLIGMINKPNYRITTPASTIGIRGTDHETFMITPDSPLAQVAPTGAYSKVNLGETTMTTDKGTINVLPNQMGFAGGMNQAPQLQPLNTNIFTVAAAPTAEAKVEKKEDKKESGDSGQDKPAAENEGGSGNSEQSTAEGNGENSEKTDAPVRDAAVVDATPPATGSIPASTAPAIGDSAGAVTLFVPEVTVVAPPATLAAGDQVINLTNQTLVPVGGGTATAITTATTAAPAGTVAPYVQADLAVAFAQIAGDYLGYLTETHSLLAAPSDVVPLAGAGPGPVIFVDRFSGKGPGGGTRVFTLDSATVGETTTVVGNGIQYGRYTSNTFAQQVIAGTINNGLAAGTYSTTGFTPVQMHWIIGPAIDPIYLPEVLLTTNTYTFFGGTTPTSSFGSASTLNAAGTSLSVNFTQQLVSFALNLTVGGSNWIASSTNAPLDFASWSNAKSGFRVDNATGINHQGGGLTFTVCAACVGVGGAVASPALDALPTAVVKGQLTGSGLDGALLSYFLNNGSEQVTGVAAFTGTAIAAPSYRLVALSAADPLPSANQFPGNVYPTGGANPNGPIPIPVVIGGYNNATSVVMDAAGNLNQFRSTGANNINNNSVMYTFSKGAAVATSLGTDPVSGISWGRWDNASFTTTEVVSGAVVTSNNNVGSAHWIASPVLVGAVTLPVTGVFNYVLAGGTAPTDSLGGAGTLNSASLSANFATQTVTVGLNVTTPNAGNLIASAANLPIEQKSFFNASTLNAVGGGSNPGSMTVTCGAGCVGTPEGHLGGAFAGAGGIGAAVLYGFSAGTTNTVIVNGAAAFHR